MPADFDSLWDYDHPDKTEETFRALLPEARAGGDRNFLAQLLTQIARCEGLQRRFEEAHRTLDEVERMLPAASSQTRVRYLLERGRVFNSAGAPDRARPLFREAWETGRAAGEDAYAVDAAHMMAIVEPGADEQFGWNQRALDAALASADPKARRWAASLHNNMGWTHFDQGRYQEALAMFEQALAEREAAGTPPQIRAARWCVAKALRMLGRVEEALAIQRSLREENDRAGEPDGFVFEETAECLLTLGRAVEAQPYFARAYDALSQDPWLAEHESDRLERLRTLSLSSR